MDDTVVDAPAGPPPRRLLFPVEVRPLSIPFPELVLPAVVVPVGPAVFALAVELPFEKASLVVGFVAEDQTPFAVDQVRVSLVPHLPRVGHFVLENYVDLLFLALGRLPFGTQKSELVRSLPHLQVELHVFLGLPLLPQPRKGHLLIGREELSLPLGLVEVEAPRVLVFVVPDDGALPLRPSLLDPPLVVVPF